MLVRDSRGKRGARSGRGSSPVPKGFVAAICLACGAFAAMGSGPAGRLNAADAVSKPAREYAKAYLLPIHDEISDVTLESLKRRVEEARQDHADLIVFELNTPGGVALSALKICTLIKNIGPIHTVAWVNTDAYSAGAIIALACDEIVMSANSTIGDCQPIMIGPSGVTAIPEDIEAKFKSPLLKELRDSAHRRGYDLNMCVAMIDPEMELFWIEDTATGERAFVSASERDDKFGIAFRAADTAPVRDNAGDSTARRSGGTRVRTDPVSDEQSVTAWRYVKVAPPLTKVHQPVVTRDELLTMSQDEAVAFGFAKGKASSLEELQQFCGARGSFTRLDYTWMEKVVEWLSSPGVRGVLFILMLLGAYAEFNHPGFGLPGMVALVCLLIFLGAPYLTGLAKVWEILVVLCGAGLLLVEIFLIPGFGVTGIAGVLLILIGFMATFVPEDPGPIYWPELDYTVRGVKTGLWVIAIGLTVSVVGMVLLSRFMPQTPYFRKLIPANPTAETILVPDPLAEAAAVGNVGRAEGPLRPAGKARFGMTLVDVVSDGEYLAAGERIEVVERAGNRIVVRRVRGTA